MATSKNKDREVNYRKLKFEKNKIYFKNGGRPIMFSTKEGIGHIKQSLKDWTFCFGVMKRLLGNGVKKAPTDGGGEIDVVAEHKQALGYKNLYEERLKFYSELPLRSFWYQPNKKIKNRNPKTKLSCQENAT